MTERMVRSSLIVSATRASRTCHRNGLRLDATISDAALSPAKAEALPHHGHAEDNEGCPDAQQGSSIAPRLSSHLHKISLPEL